MAGNLQLVGGRLLGNAPGAPGASRNGLVGVVAGGVDQTGGLAVGLMLAWPRMAMAASSAAPELFTGVMVSRV